MAAYIGFLPPVSRCHHVHFFRSGCQALACLLSPVLSAPSTARSLQAQGPLRGVRMSAHGPVRSEGDVQRWPLPGPLVWQLVCLALLAMVLSGVIDKIISEENTIDILKAALITELDTLSKLTTDELVEARYQRFRKY